jgi:hypothetical protein
MSGNRPAIKILARAKDDSPTTFKDYKGVTKAAKRVPLFALFNGKKEGTFSVKVEPSFRPEFLTADYWLDGFADNEAPATPSQSNDEDIDF